MKSFDVCPVRVRRVCTLLAVALSVGACGGGDSADVQAGALTTTSTASTDGTDGTNSASSVLENWSDSTASTSSSTETSVTTTTAFTASADTTSAGASTSVSTESSSSALLSTGTESSEADATIDTADEAINASASGVRVSAATTSSTTSSSGKAPLAWGNALRPFSVNSPWNSRPVNPVLSDVGVPKSSYYPAVSAGAYSTGVYVASATDTPMVVKGPSSTVGITNVDAGTKQDSITIPRWPSGTVPASGSDGHCEIFDPFTGIIHSFFKLKNDNGTWRASLYGWSKLNGTGWGNPAHFYQGARATGVVSSAGLIRKHEIDDGDTMYRHALAMSLTYNALSKDPTYVFPATAADAGAETTNYGKIPEGALVMLPSSFDTSKLATPKLRKVAETLKTYGAYVVDRNVGTPFVIYVELGSNYTVHPNGWSNAAAADLESIRAAMRMVSSASSWVNANGTSVTFTTNQNLLSMRGAWKLQSGPQLGTYDTWKQAVVFPASSTRVVQVNTNGTGFAKLKWAKPVPGKLYKVTAVTTGGGQFRLSFTDCKDSSKSVDSGVLNNGGTFQFTWPATACWSSVFAYSGINQASTVSASLVRVN